MRGWEFKNSLLPDANVVALYVSITWQEMIDNRQDREALVVACRRISIRSGCTPDLRLHLEFVPPHPEEAGHRGYLLRTDINGREAAIRYSSGEVEEGNVELMLLVPM